MLIKYLLLFFFSKNSKSLESRVKLIKSIGAELLLLRYNVVIDITMLYYFLNLLNVKYKLCTMTGSKNKFLISRVVYCSLKTLKTHRARI